MFTEEGYKTLKTYLKTLTKFWYTREEYPFSFPILFGVPFMDFAHIIKNKDELIGRIKVLAQILGIEEVTIKVNDTDITINLKGEK